MCVEILKEILEKVSDCGVPLGISVESVRREGYGYGYGHGYGQCHG